MLRSIEVTDDSLWAGHEVSSLLGDSEARLIAIIRQGQRIAASDVVQINAQDLLILSGGSEGLQVVEDRLLEERPKMGQQSSFKPRS